MEELTCNNMEELTCNIVLRRLEGTKVELDITITEPQGRSIISEKITEPIPIITAIGFVSHMMRTMSHPEAKDVIDNLLNLFKN